MKDFYLGRQAIYDREGKLFAYELLFRSDSVNTAASLQTLLDGDIASSEVLLNTFMEIGLERIAGDCRVFINLTRNLITSDHPLVQKKERVVMELLETIPVDEALIKQVICLSKMGVQMALDDYVFDPVWDPLLPWVSIIKLEIPALSFDQIRAGLPKLRQHKLKLLAEKVETREEYSALRDLGIDYFQGFFFSRPELIEGKRLEENQTIILRLLSKLNNPDSSIEEIEGLICQDATLSFKTLRYINSAAVGVPHKVESISKAVIFMGINRIRAWANLLVMAGLKDRPQDHYLMALVRAHLCEALVTSSPSNTHGTGFTVGLLSILDLLLGLPLEEVVKELYLSDQINDALLLGQGIAGEALSCARLVESGEWQQVSFPGLTRREIHERFLDASAQAFQEQQALFSN